MEQLDLNLSDIESQDSLLEFPSISSQAYILWRGLTLTKVNIDGELQFSNVESHFKFQYWVNEFYTILKYLTIS